MHSRSASKRLKQTHAVSQSVVLEQHHETSTNGSFSEFEKDSSISERLKLLRKSPKTDYTYSQYSKDRYEISPGVINMPNMSRLSYKTELNSSDYPDSVLRVRSKVNKALVYSPPPQETSRITTIHKETTTEEASSYFESIRTFIYTYSSVIFLSIISVIQKTASFITYPLRRIFYNGDVSSSSSTTSSSYISQQKIQQTQLYTLKNKQYRDIRYYQDHSTYSSGTTTMKERISQGVFSLGSLIYKSIGRVVVADISTIVFIRQLFNASKNNLMKYLPYLLALLLLLLPLIDLIEKYTDIRFP